MLQIGNTMVFAEAGLDPVSYTHLDVYKRQMFMRETSWYIDIFINWLTQTLGSMLG